MNDQDDESFFTKGERLSDEIEAGVGTQNIIAAPVNGKYL